jgi:hypothetical protein
MNVCVYVILIIIANNVMARCKYDVSTQLSNIFVFPHLFDKKVLHTQ